ncbi:MAG: DNA-processing protein DprA [Spirochaetota bacterium]|nr:DNA-processing protein DprA [Spirochaetota bacterium]
MSDLLRIAISMIPGLRCRERLLIEECCTDESIFSRLERPAVEEIIGRRLRIRSEYPGHSELLGRAGRIHRTLGPNRVYLAGFWDAHYPPQLRECSDPVYLLYVRGRLPAYDIPMVAIVGTRRPSIQARGAAFSLAAEFGCIGIPVVSGLAFGIDAAAHWGAVKTGQVTIAVLGTGIDHIYPAEHRDLVRRILANGGALLSEKPPGSRIGQYDFPRRNRIISGLSRGVVIVEAPEKSGALITAEWAVEDNRNVYVHTAGTGGSRSGGTRRLAAEGALRISHAGQVLADWEIAGDAPRIRRIDACDLHPAELVRGEMDEEVLRFYGMYYRRVG